MPWVTLTPGVKHQMLDEYEKISQLIDESTERKLNISTCLQAEMT